MNQPLLSFDNERDVAKSDYSFVIAMFRRRESALTGKACA